LFFFFFFNDTATTEIYTLSLHDALPIWSEDPDEAATGQRVAIDTGRRVWDVVLDRGAMTVSDGDGPSDARLSGEPSDVLLWLWGRAGDDRITFEGDAETHRVLRERLTMATQ